MIYRFLVSIFLLRATICSAEPILVNLNSEDQLQLARVLARLPSGNRREELDQTGTAPVLHKYYNFLDVRYGFSAGCHEQFIAPFIVPRVTECSVLINEHPTISGPVILRPGFMQGLVIAEVNDSNLAKTLFQALAQTANNRAIFHSQEQVSLVHPNTRQRFNAFRLRIECDHNAKGDRFFCKISGVL